MLVEVENLETAMQELLALLADPNSRGVECAWERCRGAEEELTRLIGTNQQMESPQRDELRRGLENLVRLNAITRQAALRAQDSLANSLVRAKQTGEKLRGYRVAEAGTGGSCDLAG